MYSMNSQRPFLCKICSNQPPLRNSIHRGPRNIGERRRVKQIHDKFFDSGNDERYADNNLPILDSGMKNLGHKSH
jgi:hypothetical protein